MKKIGIGCVALAVMTVAIVVCLVVGIFALGMNSEAARAESEGVDYGKDTDQLGCQIESLQRLRIANRNNNLIKRNETSLFLFGCFQTCQSSLGYCSGTPTEDDLIKVRGWAQQHCRSEQLTDDSACISLFMEVADVCLGKTKRR